MNRPFALVLTLAALAVAVSAFAQDKKPPTREEQVRGDKDRVGAMDSWIYNDLPRGIAEAKKTGKPLLVVFRCIPCEACAQIDEDVVTRDPIVAKLLDQFVCVRIPQANGMDLSLFQFDYDQSWAAFFMTPDMKILGRYGTRSSHKDSADDVSLEGFAKALEWALHPEGVVIPDKVDRPKQPASDAPPASRRPEDLPSLKGKYTSSLDWQGKVLPSCIHCHMVTEAQRKAYRDSGKPIPDTLLFPYPNPKVLGLTLDPKERARVLDVKPGSAAARAGIKAGDVIDGFDGAAVGSIADIQSTLHNATGTGSITVTISRDGKPLATVLTLELAYGWRSTGDISWRASSWDLRRITTGGMRLEVLPQDERTKLGIADGKMALRATHVGQHGDHAAAKNAGFVKGDVIVDVDGRDDVMTETAWLTWLVNAKRPGEKIAVTALREGKRSEMTLPIQ